MGTKPICVPCQRFYRCKKNGFVWIEAMPKPGNGLGSTPAGNSHPELWEPYKLWVGDLYECSGCGHQTVVGVSAGPVAEHYQERFKEMCKSFRGGAQLTVNDC